MSILQSFIDHPWMLIILFGGAFVAIDAATFGWLVVIVGGLWGFADTMGEI